MSPGCSWAYKILPYLEQQNLYTNWNYTTPIKVYMDPGRGGTVDLLPQRAVHEMG